MPNPRPPAAALLVALGLATPAAAELLPHHAIYKLSLAGTQGSKAPADASGMISYDFTGSACAGYKTVFRQVTEVEPAEGEARVSNTETTTLESGSRFTFDTRTTSKEDEDDTKGEARRTGPDEVEISLKAPEAATVDVQTAALFPTEHLNRIIATAAGGGRMLATPVFDGSDTGRKILTTFAVIGAPITAPAAEKPAQDEALRSLRRWPVTITYFEPGGDDAQPAYTLAFELYENGVSRALRVNNGSFTLAGELVAFEPAKATPCAP